MSSVIAASHISKLYRIQKKAPYETLRDSIADAIKKSLSRSKGFVNCGFQALNDVSFEVHEGEVLGIIGRNGAGKSTLLKVLCRITRPTSGEIRYRGKIGSLLEVGVGFHPELSGRENIFLSAAILGLRQKEIRQKFDEIAAFAEVESFLDVPVKRYSSGMYVRLAFSVAAHLDPDILVVDEVLAVGDLMFKEKCLGKMNEVRKSGRTVLLVSHDLGVINSLCSRAICLEGGRIIADGSVTEATSAYLKCRAEIQDQEFTAAVGERPMAVTHIYSTDMNGKKASEVELGQDLYVHATYVLSRETRDFYLGLMVQKSGVALLYSYERDCNETLGRLRTPGVYETRVRIPASVLKTGEYDIGLFIGTGTDNHTDPKASISVKVVNTRLNLMDKSFRQDRPGYLYAPLTWFTEPARRLKEQAAETELHASSSHST